MNRLTHERVNGIKTGYWSQAKKEELIQRLAAYENTGLEPEEMDGKLLTGWISVSEQLPHKNDNYLVTVRSYDETASIDFICVDHCNADGTWLHYNKPGKKRGKCVIAWMPMPEPYKEVEHD